MCNLSRSVLYVMELQKLESAVRCDIDSQLRLSQDCASAVMTSVSQNSTYLFLMLLPSCMREEHADMGTEGKFRHFDCSLTVREIELVFGSCLR